MRNPTQTKTNSAHHQFCGPLSPPFPLGPLRSLALAQHPKPTVLAQRAKPRRPSPTRTTQQAAARPRSPPASPASPRLRPTCQRPAPASAAARPARALTLPSGPKVSAPCRSPRSSLTARPDPHVGVIFFPPAAQLNAAIPTRDLAAPFTGHARPETRRPFLNQPANHPVLHPASAATPKP